MPIAYQVRPILIWPHRIIHSWNTFQPMRTPTKLYVWSIIYYTCLSLSLSLHIHIYATRCSIVLMALIFMISINCRWGDCSDSYMKSQALVFWCSFSIAELIPFSWIRIWATETVCSSVGGRNLIRSLVTERTPFRAFHKSPNLYPKVT